MNETQRNQQGEETTATAVTPPVFNVSIEANAERWPDAPEEETHHRLRVQATWPESHAHAEMSVLSRIPVTDAPLEDLFALQRRVEAWFTQGHAAGLSFEQLMMQAGTWDRAAAAGGQA